jgi:predicted transcriptional regulator
VNQPPHRKPPELRASIRIDARLDATTREKVDDLAQHFHQPRAAVLCQIMHWGLSYEQPGPLDQGDAQGPVRHLYLYVPSELRDGVEKAATAAGVKTASWLRHMVRQITITDFPASWQEATPRERSHESRRYGKRFMLRLDDPTWETLDALAAHFERSAAEIIRQLLAQATPDTFPASWHRRVVERHGEQVRPVPCDADHEA